MIKLGGEICKVCDKIFDSTSAYQQHLQSSGHGEQIGRRLEPHDQMIAGLRLRLRSIERCTPADGNPTAATSWQKVIEAAAQKQATLCRLPPGLERVLYEQSGPYGIFNSPEEILNTLQTAIDFVQRDFYELGKWLLQHGSNIRGANTYPDGVFLTAPCNCGATPMIAEAPQGDGRNCKACGVRLRPLPYYAVSNVPANVKTQIEETHLKFHKAVARLGFIHFDSALFDAQCSMPCTCACRLPQAGPLAELSAAACGPPNNVALPVLSCDMCHRKFPTPQRLEEHTRLVHGLIMKTTPYRPA